jgi:hypothetical protein
MLETVLRSPCAIRGRNGPRKGKRPAPAAPMPPSERPSASRLPAWVATASISLNVPKPAGAKRQGALACAAITALPPEPFRSGRRFQCMPNPAEAAKNTVELGKRHIIDQRFRIERQRKLIAELKCDAHPDCAVKAVRILGDMERMLAQMEVDYAGAQERLSQATTDEKSLRSVERDTPM